MKKIYFLLISLTIIVSGFIFYDLQLNHQSTIVSEANDKKKTQIPELLIFQFQPSLKENTEVIINFEKKHLIFRTIYPFLPEPPPPPRKDGTNEPFIETNKHLRSYSLKLQDEDLNDLKMIIRKISKKDLERIEGKYIDGTSYNFSILFSNKNLENGFIAQEKTKNQKELVLEILNILEKTNPFEENKSIISYYYKNN